MLEGLPVKSSREPFPAAFWFIPLRSTTDTVCCQLQEASIPLPHVCQLLSTGQVSKTHCQAVSLLIILHHPDPTQHSPHHSAVLLQTRV